MMALPAGKYLSPYGCVRCREAGYQGQMMPGPDRSSRRRHMRRSRTPHPIVVPILTTAVIAAGLAALGPRCSAAVRGGSDAPSAGVYTLAATGVAGQTKSDDAHAAVAPLRGIDASGFLPADRATVWKPGMIGAGGIPIRSTVCATLIPRGGGLDDRAQIQAAIKRCPAGQVVQLQAGTFLVNSGNFLLINKGITLRGAGPGRTTLAKTDGARPFQEAVSAKTSPLIIVGPSRFADDPSGVVGSTNLITDAVKGGYSV